jgi:hypothetical protein
MTRLLAVLLATTTFLSQGCAYKVSLSSIPTTAAVQLPGDRGTVITPTDVVFRWVPFGHQVITATADGYRPLELDLRDHEILGRRYLTDTLFRPATLFGRPRGEVKLLLVPEHGPVGTWTPDDVSP